MARNVQNELNRLSPATRHAALGDILVDLVTAVNALIADHNTMAAKLNLDAGVTDTNYAVSAATTVKAVSARNKW